MLIFKDFGFSLEKFYKFISCSFRSDIFELFDVIMIMSRGKVVYFGKAEKMVDDFTRFGYPCPELTNPCDFYGMYVLSHLHQFGNNAQDELNRKQA